MQLEGPDIGPDKGTVWGGNRGIWGHRGCTRNRGGYVATGSSGGGAIGGVWG